MINMLIIISMILNESITYLFSEISNPFWNNLDKSMKEIGLHSGQVFVLISLWETDGQSQVDLAAGLNISPASVNKMVKSLASGNFVKLIRSEDDSRFVHVYLTDKGKQIRTQVEEQWLTLEKETFSLLTDVEKLILTQILGKLRLSLIEKKES